MLFHSHETKDYSLDKYYWINEIKADDMIVVEDDNLVEDKNTIISTTNHSKAIWFFQLQRYFSDPIIALLTCLTFFVIYWSFRSQYLYKCM